MPKRSKPKRFMTASAGRPAANPRRSRQKKGRRDPSGVLVERPAKAASAPYQPSEEDLRRLRFWQGERRAADAPYERWARRYQPDVLQDFYLGHQWPEVQKDNYQVNLFYQSIEVRRPSLMLGVPHARFAPIPTKAEDPLSLIEARAQLLEDCVNTVIQRPAYGFDEEVEEALHESFFSFGVIEQGYSADVVDNPNAQKPPLRDEAEDGIPPEDQKVEKVVSREDWWIRRIPSTFFRVSFSNKWRLEANTWVGYYEWVSLDDIKANPKYRGRTRGLRAYASGKPPSLDPTADGYIPSELTATIEAGTQWRKPISGSSRDLLLLFKVFNLRDRKRHVMLADMSRALLWDEPWDCRTISVLRFHRILDSFYPLPPCYNWRSPQEERNETREMQRIHRRRFNRKYKVLDKQIKATELEKLEVGGDGSYIFVKDMNAIAPIEDASLDSSVYRNDQLAGEEFAQVSGVGGEQRSAAESKTATQAQIIDTNAKIRETTQRELLMKFLADIVSVTGHLIQNYWALPMYIKTQVDLEALREGSPQSVEEVMKIAELVKPWQSALATDIGEPEDFSWEASVSVESLSPVTEDRQRQQFLSLIALLSNPAVLPIISSSELILRKLLGYFGVRTAREIQEYQKVLQVANVMMLRQQAAAAGAGAGAGASASADASASQGGGTGQEGELADVEAIAQQLQAQGFGGN